ncbi:MAG: glycosyltransferase family 2 protein [Candidatus Omnitrophica bacterium]|nr:glycosyltransferase family 2 protein [Candidatus Omnitrophota bacterium]
MPTLSAVIITHNEKENIEKCLNALFFCNELVVVDSESPDGTAAIAEKLGAKVFLRAFRDFSSQKNFAISKTTGQWILSVDADEFVSESLAAEIREVLDNPKADSYYLKRENRIFGRRMRYGANRGDFQLRLVRREKAVFEGRVHERMVLEGEASRLKNPLFHESTPSLSAYLKKLNFYTQIEARTLEEKKASFSGARLKGKPLAVIGHRLFVRAGFLDGREGFFFSVLSGYYEFAKQAKFWELTRRRVGREDECHESPGS